MKTVSTEMRKLMSLYESVSAGMIVYHASDRKITNFNLDFISDSSLGFHFAETPELAVNAAIKAGKVHPEAHPYRLAINNPLRIKGQENGFPAFRVLDSMIEANQLNDEQYNQFMTRYEEIEDEYDDLAIKANALMREVLSTLGHDSFEYMNNFDAGMNLVGTGHNVKPALSWIVLDPKQISY